MREYDLMTACKWIGNSPAVAARHYAMSMDLDTDFRQAADLNEKAQQSAETSGCQPMTSSIGTNEKTPENGGFVHPGHLSLSADKTRTWAIQDSNTSQVSTDKHPILRSGAVKSAADAAAPGFAATVAAIMALPLSDEEKAQAVRRLLAEKSPDAE